MLFSLKKQKNTPLILLTLGLLFFSTTALERSVILGDPPSLREGTIPSGKIEFNLQISSSIATNQTIYLPLIRLDQTGLPVNLLNRQDSLDFYINQYLISEGTAINWTGSQAACDPGATDPIFRQAVLRRINYFRAMAGVPAEVTFSDEYNRLAQAAALMMSANGQLSHAPPSSWKCYSTEGASGAGSSNLALGFNGFDAITGYMKDPGGNNSAAGHRRWILYPQTQVMGTGDIPGTGGYFASNSLHVFDSHYGGLRPQTCEEYVAWPPPGYVPYQVVFPRWSFSLAGADFSGASMTMTSNGSNLSVAIAPVANGYGENTLVWIPMGLSAGDAWPQPAADTTYTVAIQHVVVNHQDRDFTYNVVVFNPTP